MSRRAVAILVLIAPFAFMLAFVFNVGGIETRFTGWLAHQAQDGAQQVQQDMQHHKS